MAEVHEIYVEIKNEEGLHMRPATLFSELANKYRSRIEVSCGDDGVVADGKSVMHIIMLGALPGSRLKIRAIGEDAQDAVKALHELVEVKKFVVSDKS